MTREQMKQKFHEALYYSDNNRISLSIVGCEKLLVWFEEAWEVVSNKESDENSAGKMYQRLYGILGYLLDMRLIDYEQDSRLLDLALEVCGY